MNLTLTIQIIINIHKGNRDFTFSNNRETWIRGNEFKYIMNHDIFKQCLKQQYIQIQIQLPQQGHLIIKIQCV